MTSRSNSRLLGWLLFVAGLAIGISLFSYNFFPFQWDEMTLAWAGKQVALGRAPYGDFFTFLPPLMLYGLGSFFKIFGASLAGLRFLSILWVALEGVFLYGLLLRLKMPAGWAAAAALQVPALFVAYWPVPSHHYFAMGLALLALYAGFGCMEKPSRLGWFVTGILAAATGLTLQTEGVIVCLLIAGMVLLLSPAGLKDRKLLWGLLGLLVPFLVVGLPLLIEDSLGWAFYDLVVWPSRYYHQRGGFNDVNAFDFLGRLYASFLPHNLSALAILHFAELTTALALPLLCLLLVTLSPVWVQGFQAVPKRWVWAMLGLLLLVLVYLGGRSDWTHLAILAPLFIALAAFDIDWKLEKFRPGLFKVWIVLALVVAAVRWPVSWVRNPPLLSHVATADYQYQRHFVDPLLARLPGVKHEQLPVLHLPNGASLYFYYAPDPPPLDWVMPPSSRCDAPWEYTKFAAFANSHNVPYIVINRSYARDFFRQSSAISRLLKDQYTPYRETPLGMIFKRKQPNEPPRP